MNESAKQMIAAELRRLRKLSGPLDAAKMTYARGIVKGLGGDDPDIALTRFIDLASEHSDDREIDAAMSSFGWGDLKSTSVLDRLSEYAEQYFVDSRTVRRWSDEGIRKLTFLILSEAPWIQPRIRQVLVAEVDHIKIGIDLSVPPNLRMDAPQVWVNDQVIEIDMAPITQYSRAQKASSTFVRLASMDDLPLTIRLTWMGEKLPTYVSQVRGTPEITFTTQLVLLHMTTTVRMRNA